MELMSIKEMLQDLGFKRISVRQISGDRELFRHINNSLVERVWTTVMNNALNKAQNEDYFSDKKPETKSVLELEIYYQQTPVVN